MLTEHEKMLQLDAYRSYRKYLASINFSEEDISKVCCDIIRSIIIEDKIVFEIIDAGLHFMHLENGVYFDNLGKSFVVKDVVVERDASGMIIAVHRC